MKYLIAILLILGLYNCSTEKKIYRQGKSYVNSMAADSMHGRGYTHNGLKKAEQYLINEYKEIGLIEVYPNYEQSVSYPINIIHNAAFSINGEPLTFGYDYIVKDDVSTNQFTNTVFQIDESILDRSVQNDKLIFKTLALNKGKIPLLDYRNITDSLRLVLDGLSNYLDQQKTLYNFPALIKIKNKLTHFVGGSQDNFTIIETTKNISDGDSLSFEVHSSLIQDFETNNIVGKIKGALQDSAIFISAHYDHLGQVNETIFSGANDNASGVSMLLSLAKYFKKNPPKYNIYFYAFTGEEAGLKGSIVAAENLPIAKNKIKFLINLDIVGTGDEGIQVVNGSVYQKEFDLLNSINSRNKLLPNVKIRGESCNSDHCPFYKKGIPSFFIYTLGGIKAYHDPMDKPQTLPLTNFYNLYQLLIAFIQQL